METAAPPPRCAGLNQVQGWHARCTVATVQKYKIDVSNLCNHPAFALVRKQSFGGAGMSFFKAASFSSLESCFIYYYYFSAVIFSHMAGKVKIFGETSAINQTAAI